MDKTKYNLAKISRLGVANINYFQTDTFSFFVFVEENGVKYQMQFNADEELDTLEKRIILYALKGEAKKRGLAEVKTDESLFDEEVSRF